jgi:predicted GIY-YIG superfamily endonuclease
VADPYPCEAIDVYQGTLFGEDIRSQRLDQVVDLLADPAKITPSLLRIKILAICEGREIPSTRKEWFEFAERAGVTRNRRYSSWAELCAEQTGENPDATTAVTFGREIERRRKRRATALYRWYDEADVLLYIGISDEFSERVADHVNGSTWMDFAVRSTIERFPSRGEAAAAEVEAIKAERPLFNDQHNVSPEAHRRRLDYLAERGHADGLVPVITRG